MKTYVITLSQTFPSYHQQRGKSTDFFGKLFEGEKVHTIRGNYAFWKKRFDEIAAGRAKLSVRKWLNKPYKSKQVIMREYTAENGIGIQKCDVEFYDGVSFISVDDRLKYSNDLQIVHNDGLSFLDFMYWFKKPIIDGCIIHFSDLRY